GSGRKLFIRPFLPSVRDLLITAGILSCITLIGFLFLQLDFARFVIDGSWSHAEWFLGSRCAGSHAEGDPSTRRKKTWLVVVTV
ncbi:hypothetical protein, partial [Faecalibacterium duncaniae]|uniref:hypothetical protein n=1 Tax=Faecalibacterium duncaniae (strain DSM 17677 / JCM 31915 / A2-165) TaxID=411483 RepID=UPI0029411354